MKRTNKHKCKSLNARNALFFPYLTYMNYGLNIIENKFTTGNKLFMYNVKNQNFCIQTFTHTYVQRYKSTELRGQ